MIHQLLEHRLVRAAEIWKWQRVARSTALLVCVALLVALTLGAMVVLGWIGTAIVFYVMTALALGLCIATWLVTIVLTVERKLDRQWLAAAVERDQERLLDRVNAAVELDQRPNDISAEMYRDVIERQAAKLLRKLPDRNPFSWLSTILHVAAAAWLFLVTAWFYVRFQPLQELVDEATVSQTSATADDVLSIPDILDKEPPSTVLGDNGQTEPWGEVRISQPGRDLRITRHEDVPLLIEAAADRPLADVFWSTTVNREQEVKHSLPEFEDPRYAVFQPILRPDQLGLGHWDFVFYHAAAHAEDDTEYKSATYFLEIIPSREELEKLSDIAYEQLEKMTGLIEQQREVIRRTTRVSEFPGPARVRQMDALAEQENRIAASAESLQVSLENRLGPTASQSFANTIQSARSALEAAESALGQHELSACAEPEQTALLKLADARRQLADLVRDHPDAFEPSTLAAVKQARSRNATTADPEFAELLQKLEREARETNAAADQLEALVENQRQLADKVRSRPPDDFELLASDQRQVQRRFELLREIHPGPFADLEPLVATSSTALRRAADQLGQASPTASSATAQAERRLQRLANEMNRRRMAYEVARADTLDRRLATNRQAYRSIENQPPPTNSETIQQTTDETRRLIDELEQYVSRSSQESESEVGKLLSDEARRKIESQRHSLEQANSTDQRSAAAKEMGASLEQLSDALAQDIADQSAAIDQQETASQLNQMRERNEALRSARQFVGQTLGRQRSIQRDAYTDRRQKKRYESLAEKELSLEQQLQRAIAENPTGFDQVTQECRSARTAMRQTAQALSSSGANAPQLADNAAGQLQQIDEALEKQQQHSRISDKKLIGEMLERLNKRLGEFAERPAAVTEQRKQQTAGQCKSVGSQACQLAGQTSGGSGGGGNSSSGRTSAASIPQSEPMQSESSSQNTTADSKPPTQKSASGSQGQQPRGAGNREQKMEAASDQLAAAEGDSEISSAARNLQQLLQSLAADLGAQQPGGSRSVGPRPGGQPPGSQFEQAPPAEAGDSGDALRPGGAEAIERGLAQLETAARRGQRGTLTPEASRALRRSGIASVIAGIDSRYGSNENSQTVIRQLSKELAEPSSPVDLRTLQSLRQQIQSLQQEPTMQSASTSESGPTFQVDPSRFPPAYRDSIQKYYQTLSEQR